MSSFIFIRTYFDEDILGGVNMDHFVTITYNGGSNTLVDWNGK